MFTRKLFVAAALLVAVGAAYSIQKKNSQIAPMSAREAKLTKCEVHGTQLKVGTALITYGIVSGWPSGYYQVSEKQFPNAKSRFAAGCVIPPNAPKEQAVKFCPQCRAAEKKWLLAHNPTTPRR